MELLETFYPESRFGGFTDLDGTIRFYLRVNALLEPGSTVVDFGCGRGFYGENPVPIRRDLQIFKGRVSRVIGMDVDEAAAANPYVDEFHLMRSDDWPLQDDSVDLIVCDDVMEHLERPQRFFEEARRTLRPGGYVCLRTPNKWSYVALISRVIPDRLHARVLRRTGDTREDQDVFPTLYRCNSVRQLRRALSRHGFDHVVYGYEAEPTYLSFSKLAYRLGVLHQRLAPRFMRLAIFAFARLPEE